MHLGRGNKTVTRRIAHTLMALGIGCLIYGAATHDANAAYDPAPAHIVRAGHQHQAPRESTRRRAWIVCKVVGRRLCTGALNVGWCESGLNPRSRGPRDETGRRRRGVWQFGHWERGRFGYGRSVWSQTRAMMRYHALAGWGPWECRP